SGFPQCWQKPMVLLLMRESAPLYTRAAAGARETCKSARASLYSAGYRVTELQRPRPPIEGMEVIAVQILGNRRFVEIPGTRTHELPPLLIGALSESPRAERTLELAEELV